MPRHLSWRKALAVPAAAALALGSLLLAAAPASADAADFSVTSPTTGSTVDSRTVVFTGTGTDGSIVNVLDTEGDRVPGTTAAVVSNGTWSTTGTYADDAPVAQTVNVNQSTGFAGDGEQTVSFSLPAAAPVTEFAVTAPAEGSTVDSRTVVFTGTGEDGSTVNVLDTEGNRVPGTTAAVVVDGTWTTTGTYADDAPVAQTVNVNQVTGASGNGEATVNFSLPAVAPDFEFSVTSPTEGSTVDSRTVVFTGTGDDGSTVNVLDTEGNRVPGTTAAVVSNGTWTTTGTYADDAPVAQTVNVNQVTGGAGRGEATVNFLLPAVVPALDAPVITSPTEGQTVVGDLVTFEGTGQPGAYIGLLIVPTALVEEASTQRAADAEAAAVPADPMDDILVDENGQWSVTLALTPEQYTAVAIQSEVAQPTELDQISPPSTPVTFVLVAAPVVTAPGAGGNGGALAATGADSSGFIGLGAALLAAGTILVLVRARRALIG